MRELVEEVIALYEIRRTKDDVSDNIKIAKVSDETTPITKNTYNDGRDSYDSYSGGQRNVTYSTNLGSYTARHDVASGHHEIEWKKHEDNDHYLGSHSRDRKKDGVGQIEHIRHMNALHNHYVKHHISAYDTLNHSDMRLFDDGDKKLANIISKKKDFHQTDKGNPYRTTLRTTYTPHPKTREPVGTSDENDYELHKKSNEESKYEVLKNKYQEQEADKHKEKTLGKAISGKSAGSLRR